MVFEWFVIGFIAGILALIGIFIDVFLFFLDPKIAPKKRHAIAWGWPIWYPLTIFSKSFDAKLKAWYHN